MRLPARRAVRPRRRSWTGRLSRILGSVMAAAAGRGMRLPALVAGLTVLIVTAILSLQAPEGQSATIPPVWAAASDDWNVVWLDSGPSHTRLDPDTDYLVMLPDQPKTGPTILEGGRNVLVLGGHIVMDGGNTDLERRAIYIKNATGTVRIQDVFIEGTGDRAFDAIAISAPEAVVELVNIRVEGVSGTFAGFHGDIVQPFGGVKELIVDGLTGRSSYQGFYLQETNGPIGSVELRNVDLAYDDNPEDDTTFLLWLDGCSTFPLTLDNVYIEPRDGQRVGSHAVRPNDVQPRDCRAVQEGREVSWPDLPEIEGIVIEGTPPGGDFVPANRWQHG